MDRLGFWGYGSEQFLAQLAPFQYPLMDRLGFWGVGIKALAVTSDGFSIR